MSDYLDRTRAVRAGEELDQARLDEFLRPRLPGVAGPLTIEQFPAGHSNLTYLLRFGDEEFVLRRPPFGSKVETAHDMGREYRVLSKLHAAYAPAPQPLVHCDDLTVLGAPFYVMRRLRGVILRRDPPPGLEISPELAARMGMAFIDNLATLHKLDYEQIGLGDLGKPEGYAQRQVQGWTKRYGGSQTDDIPEFEFVARWMAEHVRTAPRAALIHNDYKYDNVVLAADDLARVVGVLDWEMATLGDPLMDLGTAISYWIDPDDPDELQLIRWGPTTLPGTPNRRQLVERYAQTAGIEPGDMVFELAFGFFKTAVIAQQIYYRYKHGKTTDERFAFFIEATKILFRAAQRTIEQGRV